MATVQDAAFNMVLVVVLLNTLLQFISYIDE